MFIACWAIGLVLFVIGSLSAVAASGTGGVTKSGSGVALLILGVVLIGVGVFGAPDDHGQCDTTGRCTNTTGYHSINPLGD